ncbi:MAG: SUMF1/EgtB/PvdO family nonheme iron enzyme [Caldilineaceae bacterium]|nr:SUMF1/EgtB/PvdO family nonheme iron enzyme [Caldilineaceae bacterium]
MLARLGDPRFRADAWYLPDEPLLGFVEIPAGPFLMGSDKIRDSRADDDDLPQHEVNLATFYIARHPVTVAQFHAYLEATGRQPRFSGGRGRGPIHFWSLIFSALWGLWGVSPTFLPSPSGDRFFLGVQEHGWGGKKACH